MVVSATTDPFCLNQLRVSAIFLSALNGITLLLRTGIDSVNVNCLAEGGVESVIEY